MSILTKEDLFSIGIKPGPLLAKVFRELKNAAPKTKEEALAIAKAVADGTWVKPEQVSRAIQPGSVLAWLCDFPWCPSTQQEATASNSEKRRMLENKAVTLWGIVEDPTVPFGKERFKVTATKPGPNDKMPDFVVELTFFKGSKRQCSMFWDPELLLGLP